MPRSLYRNYCKLVCPSFFLHAMIPIKAEVLLILRYYQLLLSRLVSMSIKTPIFLPCTLLASTTPQAVPVSRTGMFNGVVLQLLVLILFLTVRAPVVSSLETCRIATSSLIKCVSLLVLWSGAYVT